MARPASEILLSIQIDDFFGVDILAASATYTVVYKNQPFNIKHRFWQAQGEFTKYQRTSYSSPAPAENLANKLNQQFHCNDFTVKTTV